MEAGSDQHSQTDDECDPRVRDAADNGGEHEGPNQINTVQRFTRWHVDPFQGDLAFELTS